MTVSQVSKPSVPPMPPDELVLETDRLVLRPLTLDDLGLAIALFNNPDVVKYVCDVMSPEDIRDHLPVQVKRAAGGRIGNWTATRKDTGMKIGSCVLLPLPIDTDDTDWSLMVEDRYPDAEIEVGYMLVPEAWGKGFATEICTRLLRFGFENTPLDEIKATADPENAVSQRVLTKCGLMDQGMRRAYATDECKGFGITREEWCIMKS